MFRGRGTKSQTQRQQSRRSDITTPAADLESDAFARAISAYQPMLSLPNIISIQRMLGNQRTQALLQRRDRTHTQPRSMAYQRSYAQRAIQIHEINAIAAQLQQGQIQAPAAQAQFKQRALQELASVAPNKNMQEMVRGNANLKGIWLGFWSEVNDNATDYTNPQTLESLRLRANETIQSIKEQVEERPGPKLSLPEVKVGNEFTFTNQALKDFHTTKKWKDKDAYRLALEKGPYTDALNRWIAVMQGYGFTPIEGRDKYNYRKVTFTFPSIGWHYDVTVDDACVEIITPPVPAKDIEQGEIANAMDTYIFGVTGQIGLVADEMVGSGHINIDRATGFDSKGRNLHTFLQAFIKDSEFWKRLDPDVKNAPFPDEIGMDKAMNDLMGGFAGVLKEEGYVDGDALARAVIKNVYVKNLVGEKDKDSSHYQAVNLDHYNEAKADERRVEIRRVRAQRTRTELLNELDRLFQLMQGKTPQPGIRFN